MNILEKVASVRRELDNKKQFYRETHEVPSKYHHTTLDLSITDDGEIRLGKNDRYFYIQSTEEALLIVKYINKILES